MGEPAEPMPACFFITPLGSAESAVRRRSDELLTIIGEVLSPHGIKVVRADHVAEPGMITQQIVRCIVLSPMVFADLTGANANVYYELGVAHSLSRPVVALIDKARDLTFDTAHDRAIVVGDDGVITLAQGRQVKERLTGFVSAVLSGAHTPRNVVTEAGASLVVDSLARQDPVVATFSGIHQELLDLRELFEQVIANGSPSGASSDVELLRTFVARHTGELVGSPTLLRNELLDGHTSSAHDEWVEVLIASLLD